MMGLANSTQGIRSMRTRYHKVHLFFLAAFLEKEIKVPEFHYSFPL